MTQWTGCEPLDTVKREPAESSSTSASADAVRMRMASALSVAVCSSFRLYFWKRVSSSLQSNSRSQTPARQRLFLHRVQTLGNGTSSIAGPFIQPELFFTSSACLALVVAVLAVTVAPRDGLARTDPSARLSLIRSTRCHHPQVGDCCNEHLLFSHPRALSSLLKAVSKEQTHPLRLLGPRKRLTSTAQSRDSPLRIPQLHLGAAAGSRMRNVSARLRTQARLPVLKKDKTRQQRSSDRARLKFEHGEQ